jgi:hypothetical protein
MAGLVPSSFHYSARLLRTEQQGDVKAKIRAVWNEHRGRYG